MKEEVKGSLYVMLSTLNQMVNYLPYAYKNFEFGSILNITTNDQKNIKWDKNLNKVLDVDILEKKNRLCLGQSELLKIDVVKEKLGDNSKIENADKIFWNITGGQRPLVLAVHDLVKEMDDKTHYLCYLEGNSRQMNIMKFEEGKQDGSFGGLIDNYAIENLTLDIAFQLMGFGINDGVKHKHLNLLKADSESINKPFYAKFCPIYLKDKEVVNSLIELNKKDSTFDNIKTKLPSLAQDIDKVWKPYEGRKSFGYILEDMTVYLLLKAIHEDTKIKEKIAGLYASTKINADYLDKNNQTVDEFDVIILTKTGQVINFECKSGGMSGDVAKSTNYSTYAISGVYGLPILITPLTSKELLALEKLDKEKDSYIIAAVKSANRANLEVWGIDEIKTKLKDYLKV
jgi:hypothetical protein